MINSTDPAIIDHPVDALLAAYGAGTLDPASHALVASHLFLKPEGRAFVSSIESICASELTAVQPVEVSRRDERLAAIFSAVDPEPCAPEASPILPAPLRRYLGRDIADIPFRTSFPGLRQHRIASLGAGGAMLLKVRAGRRMPIHTHRGSEITLVLQGAYSDQSGRYGRGDIEIADSQIEHRPVAEQGEDCICFVVTDAPLRLTGPIGRILDRIFAGP